jgi:hypothetical protein
MKTILNKTTKTRERYTLINESMGNCNEPNNSPTHKYSIANGIDRGNGYQGYMSIDYFLTIDYISNDIKNNLKKILVSLGYLQYK